jgi:hypothetical protein
MVNVAVDGTPPSPEEAAAQDEMIQETLRTFEGRILPR